MRLILHVADTMSQELRWMLGRATLGWALMVRHRLP